MVTRYDTPSTQKYLSTAAALLLFLFALAPSAYLAWSWRDMPHFGFYHDDGLYWVSGKSLADGQGYRIASLPGAPYQTKYPPLFPAMLSGVWKLNSRFPENLRIAAALAWLWLPIYVVMVRMYLRRLGFQGLAFTSLWVIAALNPLACVFSVSLMPELLFASLWLASLLAAGRAAREDTPVWMAAAAGLLGALAYLTRSAALPLLVTAPLCFVLRGRYGRAVLFMAAMLPAVAGWQFWVATHVSHSWDLVTLYYTNYFGFELYNVPLSDVPLVLWNNLDGFLMGVGRLLTFDIEPFDSKHFERVIAVAAIAGTVRLARRSGQLQYPLAALGFAALLLIWHYRPDPRLVFPLYPLLAAGLWTELANLARALGQAWKKGGRGNRIAAAVGASALAALALFMVFTTAFGLGSLFPRLFASYRDDLAVRRPAYQWLAAHARPDAQVFAYDDPVLFLYTRRKSCGMPIPPKLYYHNDDAGIERLLLSINGFARENRLDYVLLTSGDFYRDLHENGTRRLAQAVANDAAFREVYHTSAVSIFQFTP
jgi:hypothetical protein